MLRGISPSYYPGMVFAMSELIDDSCEARWRVRLLVSGLALEKGRLSTASRCEEVRRRLKQRMPKTFLTSTISWE